jgi:superoxide dismutase, Fe-Mn family
MKNNSRRKFLAQSAKAGIATVIAGNLVSNAFAEKVLSNTAIEFKQNPLPYSYAALEPHIDALTMEIHYSRHAAAYCKNLNDAIKAENIAAESLEAVFAQIGKYSAKVRNNGGGHYNHEFFWQCLRPAGTTPAAIPDAVQKAIQKNFGSFENFQQQFSDAAKARFGSGWAWLIQQADGSLAICSTPNQDNPLMAGAEKPGTPLLALDVWEHAYYLKYQNKRADYIAGFWNLVNWDAVAARLK